jgi:uncharacterized membrane protein
VKEFTEKEFEGSIALMLRAGVTLSAAIVIVGGILYLRHPAMAVPDYSHFHPSQDSLRTIGGIFRGTLQLDAASIIQLGLLVLIATPVARVALCIVGFARQRDKIYVGISVGVFAILMYSLIHGGR